MKSDVSVDDFTQEIECIYKDERFKVRDNGAIYRCSRAGKRSRPNDNQWTFGNPNDSSGYMDITSQPVHRILATAFHGLPPTPYHVVDHIDTNKRNNRPENLRWVTRLENILLNPITARRITIICGSVEAFLAEPSKFKDRFTDPNFSWMGAVNPQEAKTSLERMLNWANSDIQPSGGTLSDWIYTRGIIQSQQADLPPDSERSAQGILDRGFVQRQQSGELPVTKYSDIIMAKTHNAAQRDWRTPSEFLCCPQEYTGDPLIAYAENLKPGLPFCHNDLYSSVVSKSTLSEDGKSLIVISYNEGGIKEWALAQITFEDNLFMHTSLHNFFSQEGVEKQYTIARGLEWLGGDSIDDYC
jgi:hypothetical protein